MKVKSFYLPQGMIPCACLQCFIVLLFIPLPIMTDMNYWLAGSGFSFALAYKKCNRYHPLYWYANNSVEYSVTYYVGSEFMLIKVDTRPNGDIVLSRYSNSYRSTSHWLLRHGVVVMVQGSKVYGSTTFVTRVHECCYNWEYCILSSSLKFVCT